MGWLSKAVKGVVRVGLGVATYGLSEALYYRPKGKEKDAKAAAANQLVEQQQAAEMMQASEQGAGTKRKQQTRAASLLGSYAPDQTTLLG
jgi:hypothetical protein